MANNIPVYFDARNKLEQHEWKADVRHADVCCTECQYVVKLCSASSRLKVWP